MERRSRQERRTQYLDSAVELLLGAVGRPRSEVALALSHIKISDVAERAGVSKGAIYHIWPTQEAYWAELLKAMLDTTTVEGPEYLRWAARVSDPDRSGPGPTQSDLCRIGLYSRREDPAFYVRTSLLAYAPDGDTTTHLDNETLELVRIYASINESALRSTGRQSRSDLSPQIIVACADAALTGLALRHRYYPEDVQDVVLDDGRRIDMASLLIEALLIQFSEPVDGTDPQSFDLGSVISASLDEDDLAALREHVNTTLGSLIQRAESADRAAFYIQVGLELMQEISPDRAADGDVDALANIKIADIAEREGVAKGSLYHIWPSQESFRLDVLRNLLETTSRLSIAGINGLIEEQRERGADPSQVLVATADLAFDRLKDDNRFLARFGFCLYGNNPEVGKAFRDGNRELEERFAMVVEDLILSQGRRVRPCLADSSLTTFAEAMLNGLCLLNRSSPGLIDGHRNSDLERTPPSLFAQAIQAICRHFTEPV